jgi:hypothetical protein
LKYTIKLLKKSYEEVSNYLNNKFETKFPFINPFGKKLLLKLFVKKIRIKIVDVYNLNYLKNWLFSILGYKFYFQFNSDSPNYLLFNTFGFEHKNHSYENTIKIAFYTENIIPDFNEVDYAIGHSHISYLDRYFQYPLLLKRDYGIIEEKRKEVLKYPIRKKFCAALISNAYSSDFFRIKFIKELSKYKNIDMGGGFGNNIGFKVKDKISFLNSYKFSIAMENSDGDGYSTEKLIHSFISGTIPIYYGDYMIDEYINPKSYILIKGEKDLQQKIKYIISIDNNEDIYKSILKEKVIIDEHFWEKIDTELKRFFFHIFNQDKSQSFRIDK